MEGISELLNSIPQLLLFVVPGFITLKMQEAFTPTKKKDTLDTLLYSIEYSFLIGIAYCVLARILRYFIPTFSPGTDLTNFLFLVIATLFALIRIRLTISHKWASKIVHLFNPHLSSHSTVWISAMSSHDKDSGVWAKAYLKNGLIYRGQLVEYTSDPDDEKREFILSRFQVEYRPGAQATSDSSFSIPLHSSAQPSGYDDLVYLRWAEVESLELFKETPTSKKP